MIRSSSREKTWAACALVLLLAGASMTRAAVDPFAENVRSTDPLTPEQQQKTFHLPPGFEIQLIASEPDIRKPMNMAFDAKGRLWLTESREYPFPASLDKPARDSIKVIEDTNGDGRPDKLTTFVDGLNIPIGLYPYKNGVIAWSIPNIWFFQDTDGDGKADKRDILFGPLGWERDTHGNNASFRRGFDGWLYATHGYNNDTVLRGRDGTEIRLNSGNTYRAQVDGSTVQQYTWGQVNPFGLCFDAFGNLYSADCHSSPIYELLRGAYYPSFGKPHDGLGFGPVLMQHSHGSTAISGIVHVSDDLWPAEFHGNIFVGNVMTSRVNRDSLRPNGASKSAREEPDFVWTDDPWFRPVDLQYGPDGALYIADFYNRIIGHYEVPLAHPGRDRERGRIWRVVYTGAENAKYDISAKSVAELIREFAHPNLSRRMLALNHLCDEAGSKAIGDLQKIFASPSTPATPGKKFQKAHGLWALHRLGGLTDAILAAACKDDEELVRVHAMRVLSEAVVWKAAHHRWALTGLEDPAPLVQRAAADALGQHPDVAHARPLIEKLSTTRASDDHLFHTLKMALRNQVRKPEVLDMLSQSSLAEAESRIIAVAAVSIPTAGAANFLVKHLQSFEEPAEQRQNYLRHAARYISPEKAGDLVSFSRQQLRADPGEQLKLFESIREGTSQRGGPLPPSLKEWGAELAADILREASPDGWRYAPLENATAQTNPWFLQRRASADGNKDAWFLCSLPPGGEHLTGAMRSPPFQVPAQLSFFIAGHDGFPDSPAQKKNYVALRDAATGEILKQQYAPRHDLAQPVQWDLEAFAGRKAFLELTDADTGAAYAWLAAGRFEPAVVALPKNSPSELAQRLKTGADLAGALQLPALAPDLKRLALDRQADIVVRAAAAKSLVVLNGQEDRALLAQLAEEPALSTSFRTDLVRALVEGSPEDGWKQLANELKSAPYRAQLRVVQLLSAQKPGALKAVELIRAGQISPRTLTNRALREKLRAAAPETAPEIQKLVDALPAVNTEIEQIIDRKRRQFSQGKAQASLGQAVFVQSCAACHQIDGQGGLVGPQLDGIGNRGLDRVLEDLLDPNRNVDISFRSQIWVLKDGDVVSGLPRREEGQLIIVADSTGKEVSIEKNNIQSNRPSEISLMPENFGDVIPPEDFNHLLAFLLSKKASPH